MIEQLKINKMKNLNYKTMRKLVFTMLMLMTLSLSAQVKFMGIPVDGTKSEMIAKLKQKGFTLSKDPFFEGHDMLEGEFNGRLVYVSVVTNNNKVYRVFVQDQMTMNETDIKIRFNTLVGQFMLNKKYLSHKNDQSLGEDFDISYEMDVNNKRIEASFSQKLSEEEIQYLIDNIPELKESDPEMQTSLIELATYMSNSVWFTISKASYNKYVIALYYDNLKNAPNGDDL